MSSKLITIRTNLSDFKAPQYGYDRRGAGPRKTDASGQPYIVNSLPQKNFNVSDFGRSVGPTPNEDFLLRGGQLLPETISKDVSRLSDMFFDTKSPNGLLFTAKQEVLSRSGVNVLAVSNKATETKNERAFNNGIYLPTSTLAQAAVNPLGGHLLKQGLDPTASTNAQAGVNLISEGGISDLLNIPDPLGNPTYFSTVAYKERENNEATSRLVKFLDVNINEKGDKDTLNNLYNYSGGPGSVLGVGRTDVTMLSDQRTGRNNASLSDTKFFTTGTSKDTDFGFNYKAFKGGLSSPYFETFRGGTYFGNLKPTNNPFIGKSTRTVTGKYSQSSGTKIEDLLGSTTGNTRTFKTTNEKIDGTKISTVGASVYKSDSFDSNTDSVKGLKTTLDYDQLMESGTTNTVTDNNLYNQVQNVQDFRRKPKITGSLSLDYSNIKRRIEGRVNLGNPGRKKATKSYVTGNNEALDAINALPLYKKEFIDKTKPINDFCKFRIGVIDNDNPSLKTYIHFRAFLDGMSDEYSAKWNSQEFAGRGEKLYNYGGFDRSFDISWTVVAQSKQELIPMYQKLNYLASVCAPDYSDNGYMRGNLISLTIGGYLYEQVGIMTGINYTIPMESPWEIAIPDEEGAAAQEGNIVSDSTVKELPHMIKVSGFNFIPIHSFVPQLQKNTFSETIDGGRNSKGDIKEFGPERYIAISNGLNASNSNYFPTNKVVKNKINSDAKQKNTNTLNKSVSSELDEMSDYGF